MKYELVVFAVILVLGFAVGMFYFNSGSVTGNVVSEVDFSPEIIIVPVKTHIVSDSSGYYSSVRDQENIKELFVKVNGIWDVANVYFQIEEIVETDVSFEAIPNAINGYTDELAENENYDSSMINLFFVQSLNNINGLALASINSAMVADFTTVNDFRTTAHELGHLLGLKHVPESDRLMARGKNGEILDDWEIDTVRENLEF